MEQKNYPTESTALILVDVLNEFLSPQGKVNGMIQPMIEKLDLVNKLSTLIKGVREAGIKIFYAPHGIDNRSFDDIKHLHPRLQMAIDNQAFWKGTYGADFYEPLKPKDGDIILSQHRMFNSFNGTDLNAQLTKNGIERVVLAGLTSHTCIEGTGRHALEIGYHVTFLTDAVADFTDADHEAAIQVAYPKFEHAALTVEQFLGKINFVDSY